MASERNNLFSIINSLTYSNNLLISIHALKKNLIPEQLHHRDCVNLVLVIYLDQLKALKCSGAIYKEYSYQGRNY